MINNFTRSKCVLLLLSSSKSKERGAILTIIFTGVIAAAAVTTATVAVYNAVTDNPPPDIRTTAFAQADNSRKADSDRNNSGGSSMSSVSVSGNKGSTASSNVLLDVEGTGNISLSAEASGQPGSSAFARGLGLYNGKLVLTEELPSNLQINSGIGEVADLVVTYSVEGSVLLNEFSQESSINISHLLGTNSSLKNSGFSIKPDNDGNAFIDNVFGDFSLSDFIVEDNEVFFNATLENSLEIIVGEEVPVSIQGEGSVSENVPEPATLLGLLLFGGAGLLTSKKQS